MLKPPLLPDVAFFSFLPFIFIRINAKRPESYFRNTTRSFSSIVFVDIALMSNNISFALVHKQRISSHKRLDNGSVCPESVSVSFLVIFDRSQTEIKNTWFASTPCTTLLLASEKPLNWLHLFRISAVVRVEKADRGLRSVLINVSTFGYALYL